jgi:DNA modification methylase
MARRTGRRGGDGAADEGCAARAAVWEAAVKPYYDRDGIQIFCGDCREILPTLKADVVVTDPPFGIDDGESRRGPGKTAGNKCKGFINDWHPPSEWDRELDPLWLPVALDIGPVALFGHWRKRRAFEDVVGMEPRAEIVWRKDTHVGPPAPVAAQDERIWIFAREAFKPARFDTSVWDEPIIPTWSYKRHKNEKPVALMRRLVALMPGKSLVDPFAGSGTTLVAAKLEGRRAIGIEIEEKYAEIAAKRLAQGTLDFDGIRNESRSQSRLEEVPGRQAPLRLEGL